MKIKFTDTQKFMIYIKNVLVKQGYQHNKRKKEEEEKNVGSIVISEIFTRRKAQQKKLKGILMQQ